MFVVLPTGFGKTLFYLQNELYLIARKSLQKLNYRNKNNCIPMAQVLSVIVTRQIFSVSMVYSYSSKDFPFKCVSNVNVPVGLQ